MRTQHALVDGPGDGARVAGVRALVGEPLRALATTGFTVDREFAVHRARVAYLTPGGAVATLELDAERLRRLDIPVEPGWVRCVHAGPTPLGTVQALDLDLMGAPQGLGGAPEASAQGAS